MSESDDGPDSPFFAVCLRDTFPARGTHAPSCSRTQRSLLRAALVISLASLLESKAPVHSTAAPTRSLLPFDSCRCLTRRVNMGWGYDGGAAKREVEERTQEVMSFQRELALSATREAMASKEMHELDSICHELQEEVRLLATKCVESEHAVTSVTAEVRLRPSPLLDSACVLSCVCVNDIGV